MELFWTIVIAIVVGNILFIGIKKGWRQDGWHFLGGLSRITKQDVEEAKARSSHLYKK
jgi:hypothetical protein